VKELPPLAESETTTLEAFTVKASAIEPEAIVKVAAGEIKTTVVVAKVSGAARAIAGPNIPRVRKRPKVKVYW
jgi:hypothetical protein